MGSDHHSQAHTERIMETATRASGVLRLASCVLRLASTHSSRLPIGGRAAVGSPRDSFVAIQGLEFRAETTVEVDDPRWR